MIKRTLLGVGAALAFGALAVSPAQVAAAPLSPAGLAAAAERSAEAVRPQPVNGTTVTVRQRYGAGPHYHGYWYSYPFWLYGPFPARPSVKIVPGHYPHYYAQPHYHVHAHGHSHSHDGQRR